MSPRAREPRERGRDLLVIVDDEHALRMRRGGFARGPQLPVAARVGWGRIQRGTPRDELASLAEARAPRLDLTAMYLQYATYDAQPQPETGIVVRARRV